MQELDDEITQIFNENTMKQKDLLDIQSTFSKIRTICTVALGNNVQFKLVKYGSAVNGLSISGNNGSDLDLILVLKELLNDNLEKQMDQEKKILEIISLELSK
jgi:hypothetical protein